MDTKSNETSSLISIDTLNENAGAKVEQKTSKISNESDLKVAIKKTAMPTMDQSFQKHFLGPMFAKLEETIKENSQALAEIEEKLKKDDDERKMAQLTRHIPDEIKGNGMNSEGLLKNLDDLFATVTKTNHIDDPEDCIKILDNIDRLNDVTCLAASISAYLQTLNNRFSKNTHLKAIANEIYANVNHWLSCLFRFHNSNLFFHQTNDYDGVLTICKFAIQVKYDNFDENGYKLFENRIPVIYISASSKYAQIEYRKKICFELSLPLSCIQLINVNTQLNSQFDRIDLNDFIKKIDEDLSQNKVPQLLIANAGSYNSGQCDNIQQLERICTHYKIWLHLDGLYLSTLALYSVPLVIQPINSGDSITLDFGTWIGIPNLSYVTLYKDIEKSKSFIESRQNSWDSLHLTLPYWCVLQAMGHEGVVTRIRHSMNISKIVGENIGKQRPFLKQIVLKDEKQATTIKNYSFKELLAAAINMLVLVELNTSVVIFKCNEDYIKETLLKSNPSFDIGEDNTKLIDEYTSTLTLWLCDLLNSINKKIRLDAINIKNEGVCIRYSPIEHANLIKTTDEDVEKFIKSFEDVLLILDASIKCKAVFESKISAYPNLKSVNIQKWAGIGAVAYVPDYLINKKHLIVDNEEFKLEVNKLNTELVKTLQTFDGAFSLGQTYEGLLGVKFGMVNEIDALDKLATQVQNVGKTVEESSKFIEIMEEAVRKGIEKANEDLRKENEKIFNEKGVLRQIPIVGGLLNWWSPKNHVSVTGRAFNLQSGKIETTETIYKYHMQIKESLDGSSSESNQTTPSSSSSLSKTSRRNSFNETSAIVENINSEVNTALLNLRNLDCYSPM